MDSPDAYQEACDGHSFNPANRKLASVIRIFKPWKWKRKKGEQFNSYIKGRPSVTTLFEGVGENHDSNQVSIDYSSLFVKIDEPDNCKYTSNKENGSLCKEVNIGMISPILRFI